MRASHVGIKKPVHGRRVARRRGSRTRFHVLLHDQRREGVTPRVGQGALETAGEGHGLELCHSILVDLWCVRVFCLNPRSFVGVGERGHSFAQGSHTFRRRLRLIPPLWCTSGVQPQARRDHLAPLAARRPV